jgi:CRP-like cAMP-binding protein
MLPKRLRRRIMRRAVALHDRANLVSPCASVSLAAGEHLVTLGDEPQGLSPMASGGVRVMGRGADGDELELASWGPGDVVGEAGPVLRRSARADREAAHTSVALVLGREQLQEADKGHSALRAELYDPPAKRVEGMRNIVVQEALRVVREVLS